MTTEDLAGRLMVALARIARRLRQEAPAGLGHSSVSTLATLDREGQLRLSDLAASEGVRPPTMTRIVAALETDGYVARGVDPADGRVSLVRLTAAGEQLVRGAHTARSRVLLAHLATLSPGELQLLARALPVLDQLGTARPTE